MTVLRQAAVGERLRPEDARTDAELWRLIALDDHETFTELFERHGALLGSWRVGK